MITKQLAQIIDNSWLKRFCAVLSVAVLAIAIGFSAPAAALASPQMIADLSDLQQEAKEAFDDVFGSGASDRVEGNIDQSTGELKKQAGKIKGQFDDDMTAGMGDRLEGKFDQAVGEGKKQMGQMKGNVEETFDRTQKMGERKASSIESMIQANQD